jgi:hypothetical protein
MAIRAAARSRGADRLEKEDPGAVAPKNSERSAGAQAKATQNKYAMETVDDEWVLPPVPIEELEGKSCEFAFTADAKFIFGKGKLVVDHEDVETHPEARRVRITIVEDMGEGMEGGPGWSRHLRLNGPLAAKLSRPGQFAEYRLFAD